MQVCNVNRKQLLCYIPLFEITLDDRKTWPSGVIVGSYESSRL